jgi:putative heme-binding domain-containing protein
LAFNTLQLNRQHDYGGVRRNQLDALREMGILVPEGQPARGTTSPRNRPSHTDSLVNPYDASADLAARARSYLEVNCAHCHRFGGGGSAKIDLRFEQKLEDAKAVNHPPTRGSFGIADAAIVKPGEPFHSVLYYRMAKTGRGHMPHLGAELVDQRGLELIHDWIRSLSPANGERAGEPTKSLDELLNSTSDALGFAHAVSKNALPPKMREQVIVAGANHRDATIRDLFERFTPDETRRGRIGQRVKADEILALAGEAGRGKKLFFGTSTLQCKTCHRINDEGGRVGPDLSAVGKKLTRAQILENIAEPSKTIAQEFRAHLVETDDGRTFTGIVVSKTEQEIVLRDAQDKETRLSAAEIGASAPQAQSIMPEGLLRDLTPQEAADLVEFLYSLK